jgi:hypothetical protein
MKKLFFYLNLSIIIILLFPILFQHTCLQKSLNSYSQTTNQCTEQLDSAQQKYNDGNFPEAIDLIESCLKKPNLSESDQGRAYRLLGLIYIAEKLSKDNEDSSKNRLNVGTNYSEKDTLQLEKMFNEMDLTLIPQISNITPNSLDREAKGFTMIVNGSNFVNGSEVRFNGITEYTTFISHKQLKAEVPASDIMHEGEYEVYVYNPIMGGKNSNSVMFKVQSSSSFPWNWITFGGVAVAVVVGTISYLLSEPDGTTTIAAPPVRP